MQNYTYNHEIKDLLTQFLHAFDGAVVKRYNEARIASNQVGVRYVYAPKQRVLHDLVNKAQHITLPVIAFWVGGIKRDPDRVFNKLEGSYSVESTNNNKANHDLQPVPIDIEVQVSILTRFQTDMDQIVANFVPYSDPYFVISWTTDADPNTEVRSPILWSNNLGFTYPIEQDAGTSTRVVCDTTFTIKGWMFKKAGEPVGRIYKIDTNFYAVSATPTDGNRYYITSPAYTESFSVSGIPEISQTTRWLTPISYAGVSTLLGSNLLSVGSVYLSGVVPEMFASTTTLDPFSATSLSASYPPLTGVTPIQSFQLIDETTMYITYQAPSAGGFFDVILVSPAGYSRMTQTVYIEAATTQFPYVSGIEVIGVQNYVWDTTNIIWDAMTIQWMVA